MTPEKELEKIAQIAEDPESVLFDHIQETESKFREMDDKLGHLKEIDDDLEDLDERLKEESKKNLVLNLEMAKEELSDVSEKIEEQTKVMVEHNKDKSKHMIICQYLETIKKLLEKENKEDYSEIIKSINKVSDKIKDPKETKIDLNPVLDQLKSFKKVIKDDRVRVEIYDKQIDRIVNAVSFTGGRGSSGTFNRLGNQINPATEETLQTLATEATLQTIKTSVEAPPDVDITTHTNYIRKYYTNAGAVTDGIVWSPAAGKRWHIVSLFFQTSADATITFEDDKSGGDDPVLKGEYKAGSGAFLTFPEKYPMASGEDGADLLVTTSAGNIYITIVGFEV